jgi:phosphomannomutase
VVYDAMHGAGAGVLDGALKQAGSRVEVLRGEPDPRFGGGAPDPGVATLPALRSRLRAGRGRRLGLATDGDADRIAVVAEGGRWLSETEVMALLVDHLALSGRVRKGLAVSLATGSLVVRVAEAHGLAVERCPIGFKHLSRALAAGSADVAADESGGFALGSFGVDKDGILAGCLMAELVAGERRPLLERLESLRARHGGGVCGRAARPVHEGARKRLEALRRSPPARLDGAVVERVQWREGLYLTLSDGFVMLRVSGTEPVVRIYAEAPGPRLLRRRLGSGAQLLGPAGASPGDR